jgi:hypothetical protein
VASNSREKLRAWLDSKRPARIEAAHWPALIEALAPLSERALRKLVRESNWPLAPLVEGVRQDSLDDLDRTLRALAREYEAGRPREARAAVLEARQHAGWALRRRAGDAWRQEAIQWMRVWLENPPVFESWARLRRQVLEGGPPESG